MPAVYLFASPEIKGSATLIKRVLNELLKPKGPLVFRAGSLTKSQQKSWEESLDKSSFYTTEKLINLSFDARKLIKCNNDDFVVTLTSLRHFDNWFSATSGRDIFVTTTDWDLITKRDPFCCMAHQVVENIFQSLLEIYWQNADGHSNVHMDPIGCLNDFCGSKPDVLLKMTTANICPSCEALAKKRQVSEKVLNQIEGLLENLRGYLKKPLRGKENGPEKIKIDEKGNVFRANGEEINFSKSKIQKLLFIFYLIQQQPVYIQHEEHRPLLDRIAGILKGIPTKSINGITEYGDGNNFRVQLTNLNIRINDEMGPALARYYTISPAAGRGNGYMMTLPNELREIHPIYKI